METSDLENFESNIYSLIDPVNEYAFASIYRKQLKESGLSVPPRLTERPVKVKKTPREKKKRLTIDELNAINRLKHPHAASWKDINSETYTHNITLQDIPLYVPSRLGVMEFWLYRKNLAVNSITYRTTDFASKKISVHSVTLGIDCFFDVNDAINAYRDNLYVEIANYQGYIDAMKKHVDDQVRYDEIKFSKPAVYQGPGSEFGKKMRKCRIDKEEEKNGIEFEYGF